MVIAARNFDILAQHANAILRIDGTGGLERINIGPDFDNRTPDDQVKQLDQESTCADTERLSKLSSEVAACFPTKSPLQQLPKKPSYSALLSRINQGTTWVCLAILTCFALVESMPPLCLRIWFPIYNTPDFPYKASVGLTLLGEIVFACSTKLFQSKVTRPIQTDLHERLVDAALTAPMEFMTPTVTDEASSLLSQGVELIDTKLFFGVFSFAYGVYCLFYIYEYLLNHSTGVSSLIVIVSILGSQHAIGLIQLPLLGLMLYSIHRTLYPFTVRLGRVEETVSQTLCASFSEAICGVAHIRTLQWQDYHWDRVRYVIDQAQKIYRYSLTRERLESLLMDLVITLIATFTVAIASRYTSDPYKAGISLYMITQVRASVRIVLSGCCTLNDCADVLTRADKFTTDLQGAEPIFDTILPPKWPRHGRVEFRDVVISPAYPANLNLTIENVTIPSRADAGIVGNPYTGKSALLMAIQGLIPYDGSIKIDGIEVREIPSDKIRHAFTVIPQSPVIIRNGTIRQNLVPQELLSRELRNDHEFQRDLLTILISLGLANIIEQCGGVAAPFSKLRLTHAQLQRFAMAQGIMKFYFGATRFVLIDSALSTVDSETLMRMLDVSRRSFGYAGATIIQTASYLPLLQNGSWLATINGDGLVQEARWFNNNHNHQSNQVVN